MIAFDTEDDTRGKCVLVCLFNGSEFWDFHGPELRERAREFINSREGEVFWAHNLE